MEKGFSLLDSLGPQKLETSVILFSNETADLFLSIPVNFLHCFIITSSEVVSYSLQVI